MGEPTRSTLAWSAIVPVAVAIGVFGVIYGATAGRVLGPEAAVASSFLVFSGAAQFTMVGLIDSGATTAAVIGAVAVLGLRHLPLGAVLRPRLHVGPGRRAVLAWFLVDETAGLSLATTGDAARMLWVAGCLAYGSWCAGTLIGVAGADLSGVEPLAAAVFPVLFVGLAALTARSWHDSLRAVVAGVLAVALLLVWPGAGALGCMAVAAATCLVGPSR
jgi:predicted branched-subunit amino acid permease